ncbi:MAG: hypothetical protein JW863_19950 [Chitinispirillaceae bacterium]|nr:hypothetical protein [Chitinispirillaceae bacterium]
MNLRRSLGVLFVIISFKLVSGAPSQDPMWLFKDLPNSSDLLYIALDIYDTCRSQSFNKIIPTDTGVNYDGSAYINLDYQFTTDTLKIIDRYDSTNVKYSDYRPGYAGFKLDWDYGMTAWNLAKYKYLVLSHLGPLPGHKLIINFGYNSGCGTPTIFHTIGEIAASTTWKRDSILIPDHIRKIPPQEWKNQQYYEMQVIINNVDGSLASSAPGILKIDDIAIEDTSGTFDNTTEEEASKGCGCGTGTGLALLPPMLFRAVAWRRRRRRDEEGLDEQA